MVRAPICRPARTGVQAGKEGRDRGAEFRGEASRWRRYQCRRFIVFPRTSALCIGVITITCRGKVMFTMCSTDLLRDGQIHEFPESIIRLGVDVIDKD